MNTFSFVIPTYNHYDLLHQTLYDIYQKCSPVHEVIVVDDCSTEQAYHDGLDWWYKNGMLPIRVVKTKENSMFLKASNLGLKKAEGDVVCLLSNDVRIHQNIVKIIFDGLSGWKSPVLIGGRIIDWDSGWNTFNKKTFPYVEGWLLATERYVWKDVDYFDERYAPSDMEDVDLSATIVERGGKLLHLPEDCVTHIGAQSIPYGSEREKITITNKENFRRKWIENEK